MLLDRIGGRKSVVLEEAVDSLGRSLESAGCLEDVVAVAVQAGPVAQVVDKNLPGLISECLHGGDNFDAQLASVSEDCVSLCSHFRRVFFGVYKDGAGAPGVYFAEKMQETNPNSVSLYTETEMRRRLAISLAALIASLLEVLVPKVSMLLAIV